MILAGDIGGTKTAVALFDEGDGSLRSVREATFQSMEHPSLEAILSQFLQAEPPVALRAACFGVAGPVLEGKSQATNLPWRLDEQVLSAGLGGPRVKLLNDLEAMAYGMLDLRPEDFSDLNPGVRSGRKGNMAVIAAGTGLGEALLYWDGERYHPLASEGGHADFAPRTDEEIELLRYLHAKYSGHVSCERVLSGPGFNDMYLFLRDRSHAPEPPWLAEQMKSGDPNAAITAVGLAGRDPVCVATVEMFAVLYGAEAGNLALKCMAIGGVFVGGGIAPKMLPALRNGSFLRGFTDKGRFCDLLRGIAVRVALNPRAPLLGAAHYALRLV
jgi:glucokinase